jgi:hypothetical protein
MLKRGRTERAAQKDALAVVGDHTRSAHLAHRWSAIAGAW